MQIIKSLKDFSFSLKSLAPWSCHLSQSVGIEAQTHIKHCGVFQFRLTKHNCVLSKSWTTNWKHWNVSNKEGHRNQNQGSFVSFLCIREAETEANAKQLSTLSLYPSTSPQSYARLLPLPHFSQSGREGGKKEVACGTLNSLAEIK